jgi:hypothetical protein
VGFRDDMRALCYSVRSLPGGLFDMRPYSVAVRVTTWSGSHPGDGTETATSTAITEANGQPPKVRFLNDEEIALGGLPSGSVEVGPITPDFPGGGTALSTLAPASPASTVHYILTGPEFPTGAVFERASVRTDRAFHYLITLKPVSAK